jgi:hypothetical protein
MSRLDFERFSVKELKEYLDEHGVNYAGCFEKRELIDLAQGKIDPANGTLDKLYKEVFGACASMAADYENRVRDMSIKELKAHLKERGIDTAGALEKDELIELALSGGDDKRARKLEAHHELSEHLLEC